MVTVLGGGISGLSAAYYLLRRANMPVTLYEAAPRLGGWIRTEQHADKGFMFETGPRTIRPKGILGANTLELIDDIDLEVEAIPSGHAAAKNRLIYAKGQLCLLPNSLAGIFKTLPPFSKPLISHLLHDWRAEKKVIRRGDESIYDFIKRRFGDEIADYAISPLICGICAGNAKEISVRFLLSDLFDIEQKYGSITRGLLFKRLYGKKLEKTSKGIFSSELSNLAKRAKEEKWSMYRSANGLEALPRKLGKFLTQHDVNLQTRSACLELSFQKSGIEMNVRGRKVHAEHVISALPAHKLAPCVQKQHPSLAAQLLHIPYVDVVVINLQYDKPNLLKREAFGLLVPPIENISLLGIIFDSCCFDMGENTVLTVMMGGHWFEQHLGRNPTQRQLLDVALSHIKTILGISEVPKFTRVNLLHKCIPQYTIGHRDRINSIRSYIRDHNLPLSLCGAAYDGVGINDVILSARRQVNELPNYGDDEDLEDC